MLTDGPLTLGVPYGAEIDDGFTPVSELALGNDDDGSLLPELIACEGDPT